MRLPNSDGSETKERFDLVVGTDILRSTLRKLVFGSRDRFTHSLGVILCAYQLRHQVENFCLGNGVILNDGSRSPYIFTWSQSCCGGSFYASAAATFAGTPSSLRGQEQR
mgnify:CR=1 FL=1